MKLIELDARFYRYEIRVEAYTRVLGDPLTWKQGDPTEIVTGPRQYKVPSSMEEAQCVFLQCPACATPDGGGHYMEVTFADRGVAEDQGCHNTEGKPTRWQVSGTGLENLSTQPSIQLIGGCAWHGYITNGETLTV